MEWIAAKSLLGLPRWGVGLAAILLLGAALLAVNHFTDRAFDGAEEAGAAKAEVKGHETTLDQLGKAHEAESRINDGRSPAAYQQCVRDSAPGFEGNCERYKPL